MDVGGRESAPFHQWERQMLQRPVQSLSVINSRPIDSLKEGPDSILLGSILNHRLGAAYLDRIIEPQSARPVKHNLLTDGPQRKTGH